MSDGSDFVLGADDGRTRRALTGGAPQTCIKFTYSPEERKFHEEILDDELKTNTLFRDGWDEAEEYLAEKDYLEENDFLAVFTYTLEDPKVYSEFNNKTRKLGPNDANYDFKAMYYFLSAAIHDISKTTPQDRPYKVYRGVTHSVTAQVGQPFHFNSFASTSTDQSVAERFLTNKGENVPKTLFIIETYQGGKIDQFSAVPSENEVLVPPCEKFKVLNVSYNVEKERQEIHLKSLGMIVEIYDVKYLTIFYLLTIVLYHEEI